MVSLKRKIERDFDRDVWCLFGLPVDNLTLSSTQKLLYRLAKQDSSSVLSTINVNWVVSSFSKPDLRLAILNSNIVSLDGKPLLWLSKLLCYPMSEVVAGSTLVQELNEKRGTEAPLALFLFGGEDGVAEEAKEKVNKKIGGLNVVGTINPGFGSIKEMSAYNILESINNTKPDLLLVALGAAKGTQWIESNRSRLNAKVISHLGATINFLAGTVKRAPAFFRWAGIEWIWRILQEPKLFSRYAYDGIVICSRVLGSSFLWLQYRYWQRCFKNSERDFSSPLKDEGDGGITLSFGPIIQGVDNKQLRSTLSECIEARKNVVLDFNKTEFVDGSFMGLLLLFIRWQQKNNYKIRFINVHGRMEKLFRFFYVEESVKAVNSGQSN